MELPRRQRRQPAPGEFSDPLKDYTTPRSYSDDFEKALMEDAVADLTIEPFETIGPDATVEAALQAMARHDIACLMIVDDDRRLLGVFSERDVLNQIVGQYEQLKAVPVRAVMTNDPLAVYVTDAPAKAINVMAIGGFRHVPVLDTDNRVVGIIGPRRMTAYLADRFAATSGSAAGS